MDEHPDGQTLQSSAAGSPVSPSGNSAKEIQEPGISPKAPCPTGNSEGPPPTTEEDETRLSAVVRIGSAMLLGAGGVLLALCQFLLLGTSGAMTWRNTLWATTAALFSLGTAFYFSRPRDHWNDRIPCPRCHARQTLRRTVIGQPKISVLAWILGGFIGSVLYCNARKQRFRCNACQAMSAVRTPGGRLAAAWLVLLILSLGLCA